MMTRLRTILLTLAFVCIHGLQLLAGIPPKSEPPRLVNDFALIFSASEEAALEQMLTAFDDSTSNQIAVVTVNDLEGYEPSDYAARIGLAWGVGSVDFNNGIVLLVKPKTDSDSGKVAIQVGYGLEGAIPDAYAKRIIEYTLLPHFREGDYYGGVRDACDELMALASGEISVPRDRGAEDDEISIKVILFFILVLICLLYLWHNEHGGGDGTTGGGRHIYIGPIYGGRSSSSGGFGGFGGGGFGGFGGGSFGGGGASGSW